MRRREALTLIAGSLLSTGLLSSVLAKPGKGNGNGHGNGGSGGGDNGGSGGGTGSGGKKPKSVVLNGVVKGASTDGTTGAQGFTLHANGHGPGGYDVTVAVTADTLFLKGEHPIQSGDVATGAMVQVRGTLDASTQTLTATQVKLKKPGSDNGGSGTELEGTVASVNTTGFVVQPPAVSGVQPPDVNVVVTGTTKFQKPDGTAGSMADVVVGAQVTVHGAVDTASSSLVAAAVTVTALPPATP